MTSVTSRRTPKKIFSLPDDYTLRSNRNRSSTAARKNEDIAKLIKYIDDNIIGKNSTFQGPFGRRKVVYCDYVASGRSLQFIEDYIIKEVLPSYGNTHASTNITSLQSTLFRQEARDIIRNAVNASEDDVAIFTGHGCSAAVYKLLTVLGLNRGDSEPPIVFAGSCDHHTNLLPWREIGAQIVKINETKEGHLDLNDLENQLQMHYHDGKMLIGCFSAVSNITGIETDTVATTLILHQYGALSFWDYATAAPYIQIDMNPAFPELNQPTVFKDAIFFSGHKFIGGVQTPGILVAKKSLFRHTIPVCYMQLLDHHCNSVEQYVQETELRQEGATAAVVESIRAALAVQLKETIGTTSIISKAEKISKNMLAHFRTLPEVLLLGSGCHIQKRLPIFSFMVRHPRGTFLHHNFVCAVLNDVFGIQARAGCACAGPFAQDLLGIDNELAAEYESLLIQDQSITNRFSARHVSKQSSLEVLRPGFTRVSLPYCMTEPEVTYVMEAIKMVATEGWKLLPQYILCQETGEWRHHTNMMCKDRKWLASIRYTDGKMVTNERRISGPGTFPQSYSDCLQTARNIFNRARKMAQKHPVSEQCLVLNEHIEKLRWFMLPSEAQDLLLGNSQNVKHDVPFQPFSYFNSRHHLNSESSNSSLNQTTKKTQNVTPFGSPRHFSLPVMDDKCTFCYPTVAQSPCSQDANSIVPNTPPAAESPIQSSVKQTVHFAVGEAVMSASLPQYQKLNNPSLFARNRCHSLGSETSSPPLCTQNNTVVDSGERHSACGQYVSHTDLVNVFQKPEEITYTSTSSGSGSDCSIIGRISPNTPLSRHSTDNLQAYLKEVTKELATEIKSEIRGVISKVEDVLESTDSVVDMTNLLSDHRQNSSNSDCENSSRGNSISANDVAEYLMGVSKEMAHEVKYEIREMVNQAVDIQLENQRPSRCPDRLNGAISKFSKSSQAGSGSTNDDSDDSMKLNALNKSHSSSKLNDNSEDSCVSLDLDVKSHQHIWSTINSVSSQDSGINLSFHEQDSMAANNIEHKPRSSSESSTYNTKRIRKSNGMFYTTCPRPFYLQRPLGSDIQETSKDSVNDLIAPQIDDRSHVDIEFDNEKRSWCSPPKNVWKPFMEANNEFEMVVDGDKVLIALSGGISSLTLLHTLLQYQYYAHTKGIELSLGAATVNPNLSIYDTRPLIPYLQKLNIEYLYEEEQDRNQILEVEENTTLNTKNITNEEKILKSLYSVAKSNGYNVLALGHNMDDLAECFIGAIFKSGKMEAMKANYLSKEYDIRLIRPLIYAREESLRQFVDSRNIIYIIKKTDEASAMQIEKLRMRRLLNQQEINFPNLFSNLRTALQPLIMASQLSSTTACGNDNSSSSNDDSKISAEDSSNSSCLASSSSGNTFNECDKE